mmetsp:Transcript_25583/g.51073  ORF Transcript_25583/g.51073 Transcript_25583/m.51073 type:complete len:387 (-) Transcript_25583:35-1195(-)
MFRTSWLILLITIFHQVSARTLNYEKLNSTLFPLARCNDGSTAGMYTSTTIDSSATSPRTFVIYLSSGGWCYSKATCDARWLTARSLMSSKGYKETEDVGGIFDSEALDDSTVVWINVPYCSSDGHMGNSDNSDLGFEFRGHEIVKAVLQTTKDRWGVGAGDVVVFGGASAGARGAMVHLDYVQNHFFNESEVLGVLDSPLWVDLDPPDWSGKEGLLKQTAAVYDVAGVGEYSGPDGVVTEDCSSAHKGEEYKCLFGEYRMPFVRPPHLLVSAEYDSFQLGQDGLSLPFDDKSNFYASLFGHKMHSVFGALAGSQALDATFYSQPCYNHAISMSSKYFQTMNSGGLTLDDAFKAFLSSPTGFTDLTSYCNEGFSACTADGTKCSGE